MSTEQFQRLRNAPLLLVLILLCITLEGCSLLGIRTTEEAVYTIEKQVENIEIRRYERVTVVETFVEQANYRDATGQAFGRLFDYISGANSSANDIAMTAPVIVEPRAHNGQNIPMGSPVIASPTGSERKGWSLKFVLPALLTLENAPLPTDPLVKLYELPAKRVASISYSGLWSENKFQEQVNELNTWLVKNNYMPVSLPSYAGYDPPWALPFLRRNEVLIDIHP